MTYTTTTLDPSTWDVFADLVERNNGIFGGCWCIGFHPECGQRIDHRQAKYDRVHSDAAHAALVLDDEGRAQGFCVPDGRPPIAGSAEAGRSHG